VQAERRKNFTEIQKNKTQERDRNGRRNAKVSHLAEPAVRFVMPGSMRVGHDLQQEKQGNQRKGEGDTRGKSAALPNICRPYVAAFKQKNDLSGSRGARAQLSR